MEDSGAARPRADGSIEQGRGTRIGGGRYELLEIAGVGGMASVWRAVLRGPGRFQRTVAVKHMHRHLAEQPRFVEMFCEEARVGAALQDRNIAQVYELLEEEGQYYLVLEWVEGIDLATYIQYVTRLGKPTRWELIAAVGIGMLRGLAAAHERALDDGSVQPILHRDVSPHNVLISVSGPAKLIDFGLSLAVDRDIAPTPPGMAKGKMAYLSPEVVCGERPTPASDQFAAGTVLWEALAGRRLFHAADPQEALYRLTCADVEPLAQTRSRLPRQLVATVHKALAADPAERFPSVRDMANQLGHVLKAAEHRIDLYQLLADAVRGARTALGMGRRTQAVPTDLTELGEESAVEIDLLGPLRWLKARIPFLRD
jgi:eukaryotic-like serine/threonine-protein kinase